MAALVAVVVWRAVGYGERLPDKYVRINDRVVSVEIADTPEKQIKGLSNHAPLAENQGMLFVFANKDVKTFWMKEMRFALDIIWIDDNKIVNISHNLPPEGIRPEKLYSSNYPVNFVLEVNAGWAANNDVKIGDEVLVKI